jgi:hypothetical protein
VTRSSGGAVLSRDPLARAGGPGRRSRRARRWSGSAEADLLRFSAAQGFLKSWVQITVQQDLPEQTTVLLSVIGGFLALRELQAEVDASAAVGGIVASGAG